MRLLLKTSLFIRVKRMHHCASYVGYMCYSIPPGQPTAHTGTRCSSLAAGRRCAHMWVARAGRLRRPRTRMQGKVCFHSPGFSSLAPTQSSFCNQTRYKQKHEVIISPAWSEGPLTPRTMHMSVGEGDRHMSDASLWSHARKRTEASLALQLLVYTLAPMA